MRSGRDWESIRTTFPVQNFESRRGLEDWHMLRRLFGTLTVLLLAAPVFAQQGTTELRGRVVDSGGGALPGVTVTIRNEATGMFRETVSSEDGSFIASSLTPGTYEATATLQGFKTFNRKGLILEVG